MATTDWSQEAGMNGEAIADNVQDFAEQAEASATAAAALYDNFDDRYLGAKVSNPTLDNDGGALLTGALYFNSVDGVMKVYNGASWTAAYASISGVSLDDVTTEGNSTTNAITVGAATVTGNLAVDTDTLVVNATNDRVGINVPSPTQTLDVKNTGTAYAPTARFTDNGEATNWARVDIKNNNATNNNGLLLYQDNNGAVAVRNDNSDGSAKPMAFIAGSTTAGYFDWQNIASGVVVMRLDSGGKLGVGTGSPNAKLQVSPSSSSGDQGEVAIYLGNENVSGRTAAFIKNTTSPRELTIRASNSASDPEPIVFELDSSTEAMRINDDGRVDVGAPINPTSYLNVESAASISPSSGQTTSTLNLWTAAGSSLNGVIVKNANGVYSVESTSGAHSYVMNTSAISGYQAFEVNSSERMRITKDGYVGIGTATPARTLHVNAVMRLEPTTTPSSPSAGDLYFDSSTNKLRCYNGTTWNDCF